MANDLEELVLSISADTRQMTRFLKKMEGDTSASTRKVEREFDRMAKQIDGRLSGIGKNAFRGLLGGITAALGLREFQQLADTWTDISSRVQIAAGSMEKGEEVMGRLSEMARRTYSSFEQTAESYLLNAKTLTELGYSTQTQLNYTEALNNALVVSGAKGDKAASVMNALSKAMALGKLSGDDLNTVIASGGRVAEALAASMGVTTLQLRKLGADGKITRKELIGITSQLAKLREEADGMQATISDAFVLMKNALLEYIGGADQAQGASRQFAEAIILVADNFELVGDTAVKLGFVIASALVAKGLGSMIAVLPTAVVQVRALVLAMQAGALTAAGFSAAMGPIGIVAGAAAAALFLLHDSQTEAERAAGTHEASLRELRFQIESVDYANGDAVASTREKISADIKAAEVALTRAKAERELAASIIREEVSPSMSLFPAPEADDLENTVNNSGIVKDRQAVIEQVEKQVADLKAAQADFEDYASGKKKPERDVDRPISVDTGDGKKAKKTRLNEYERLTQQVVDRTAALVAETEAQRQINPLINDYGYAAEKARMERELLTAAEKAGKEIIPQLRAEIAALADQYALAGVESAQLAESQSDLRRRMEDFRDLGKDVVGGFISDLQQGKSATEALGNAVVRLGQQLVESGLTNIFGQSGSTNWVSSLFGSFFSGGGGAAKSIADPWAGLRLAGGGTVSGPGGPTGDKIPAMLSDGEHVTRAAMVKKYGPLLAAINADRVPGFSDGGFVAPRMPAMPSLKATGAGAVSIGGATYNIDARGAQKGVAEEIRAELAAYDRQRRQNLPNELRAAKVKGRL